MNRTLRSQPMLSPGTAKALVAQFASRPELDTASSSSESPDSLYSNGSPTFADQAFEFDPVEIPEVEVEERDEDDYESLMGSSAGRDGWAGAAWGRWPESALDTEPGWSPSSKSDGAGRKASIISLSPRGSISNSLNQSRRGSTPHSRLRSEGERRDSDPSLLGFDLAQRRRSSVRSLSSGGRRRSSVLSIGSLIDPAEDQRLRNIASMELLRRRFSEVVEVTLASDDEGSSGASDDGTGRGGDDLAIARAALSQRSFSPYSDSEDEEDSEIHTAPYFPTPELPSRQPGLLSNYPLASAVQEDDINLSTPSDFSAQPSPVIPTRLFRPASTSFVSTPPPPAQPLDIIRGRSRPAFPRAATDYQFPPRSQGVPLGAAPPRPSFGRSISTPLFSGPQKLQDQSLTLEKRAAGSFPLARPTPLGTSPLRASLRRQSVVSDGGESRRGSLSIPALANVVERRASVDSRRGSVLDRRLSIESGRRPSVVERRMSLVERGSIGRRSSADTRRSSNAKQSLGSISGASGSRKSSTNSLGLRRGSGLEDGRRSSKGSLFDGRRSSLASRKSSVVSIGEYGYLAPQIVIDVAAPTVATIPESTSSTSIAHAMGVEPARLRSNAPRSIALPSFTFPATTAPNTPYTPTPRFNPLDTFLGKPPSTPGSSSGTGTTIGPLTPTSEGSGSQGHEMTPRAVSRSIMDRGRPISPPEFRDSFPLRTYQPMSPRSTTTHGSSNEQYPSSPDFMDDQRPPSPKQVSHGSNGSQGNLKLGVVRKAVPQLSNDELFKAIEDEVQIRQEKSTQSPRHFERRGAVELFAAGEDMVPRPPIAHRRTTSGSAQLQNQPHSHPQALGRGPEPGRPLYRRQATLPAELNGSMVYTHSSRAGSTIPHERHQVPQHHQHRQRLPHHSQLYAQPQYAPQHQQQQQQRVVNKKTSVTFSPEVAAIARPSVSRSISSSSFSRFFHGKSKSTSVSVPIPSPGAKPLKPSLRPVSMEGSNSSGSDKTLVEVRDMLKKMGSPRQSPKERNVERYHH